MSVRLEINPKLDIGAFARAYAQHGIVRVPDVLTPGSAEAVSQILEKTPWEPQWSETGESAAARDTAVLARARAGFAYRYLHYRMVDAYLDGQDPGLPIHGVTEFLNGSPFVGLMRAITARQDIVKAMAIATNFRPGDFLTWHDDSAQDQSDFRACAYTLSFSKLWRPDWGGQLLFHDTQGQIASGMAPMFNCLNLFSVPRPHSVAPVAPYAGAPRLSIVGWGRTDKQ